MYLKLTRTGRKKLDTIYIFHNTQSYKILSGDTFSHKTHETCFETNPTSQICWPLVLLKTILTSVSMRLRTPVSPVSSNCSRPRHPWTLGQKLGLNVPGKQNRQMLKSSLIAINIAVINFATYWSTWYSKFVTLMHF